MYKNIISEQKKGGGNPHAGANRKKTMLCDLPKQLSETFAIRAKKSQNRETLIGDSLFLRKISCK